MLTKAALKKFVNFLSNKFEKVLCLNNQEQCFEKPGVLQYMILVSET